MEKLNFDQMAELQGGDAYCDTLTTILRNNCLSSGAAAGALYGWLQASCGTENQFWYNYFAGQQYC